MLKDEKSSSIGWGKKGMAAILGALFFLNNPEASQALQSGGRSGGSSFRSSGSTRSYSMPSRSSGGGGYSSGYRSGPSINIMPMPMFSPFGYGSPFGFSPFGFMPINLNFVLIAGAMYLIYNALSNRIGGSDFSSDGYSGAAEGASVVRLTVSLDADWGNDRNIMQQLSNLAAKYNAMTDRSDLSRLLSETSLALLRTRGDWTASSYSGEQFRESNFQKAESSFQQLAIKERAKFEEENSNPDYNDAKLNLIKPSNRFDGLMSIPTQAVVSIVVALRGKSEAANIKTIRSSSDVIACLERLAADALTDEGENVMALEVLWSPSARGATLSERDLIMDYPDLMKL